METHDHSGAKLIYQQIVSAGETLRSQGALPDTLRRSFFSTIAPAYKALAFLQAELGTFDDALAAAELSKARTLLELTATRTAARVFVLTEEERSKLVDLEFQISQLDSQIPTVSDLPRRAGMEARRNELATEFAGLHSEFQAKYPKYRDGSEVRLADGDDLKKLISKDSAFLNFLQLGPRMLLLWATGDGARGTLFLDNLNNLAETIDAYRSALSKPDGVDGLRYPAPGSPRLLIWKLADGSFRMQSAAAGALDGATIVQDIVEIRHALSAWLLASLPRAVLAKQHWIVSPDGPLALLPFETLEAEGKLIIETHDVSSIQSLSMLRLAADREREYSKLDRQALLVIGDPVYQTGTSSAIASVDVSSAERRGIDNLAALTRAVDKLGPWPNLPGAASELETLAKTFGLQAGRNLFAGADASKVRIRALQRGGELAQFRYVVFSTHGYLDRDNPALSGIVLSQVDLDADNDGYLRAAELATYDFRSDLIVISACETGVGTWVSGEGILGLPFSLYVGGNRTTLLTLWPIFDGSTSEFIGSFFSKIQAGISFGRALSETKREFARGDAGQGRRSPAIWAPFVLYGSGE
jgi:CHAT domain-containing protein